MRPDPITNVSCKYGAPMGRRDDLRPGLVDEPLRLHLAYVRLNQGGYDDGGAYWGMGQRLYVAWCYDKDDYRCDTFLRACDREDAKAQLIERFPLATFYR